MNFVIRLEMSKLLERIHSALKRQMKLTTVSERNVLLAAVALFLLGFLVRLYRSSFTPIPAAETKETPSWKNK